MAGQAHTVNSEHSKLCMHKWVDDLYEEHKYVTFDYPKIGAARSLSANSLSHIWYNIADKMLSDQVGDNRRYCKLHFGVPILRGECEKFRSAYDKAIKPFDYSIKLQLMDFWPVTSIMSREQMGRYLTAVQIHYASNHALVLESRGEFNELQRKAGGNV